jgi:hypothetical protein
MSLEDLGNIGEFVAAVGVFMLPQSDWEGGTRRSEPTSLLSVCGKIRMETHQTGVPGPLLAGSSWALVLGPFC